MAESSSAKEKKEFVIGNRAEELLECMIQICDPKNKHCSFPAYLREELCGEMIRAAREILKSSLFANGCRGDERTSYQRQAYNYIVYLNFLCRAAYNNGWITEKQHDRIIRYTEELTRRIYNWRRSGENA